MLMCVNLGHWYANEDLNSHNPTREGELHTLIEEVAKFI